jgi:hypothetical protein
MQEQLFSLKSGGRPGVYTPNRKCLPSYATIPYMMASQKPLFLIIFLHTTQYKE